MINAGKYSKKIKIYNVETVTDAFGFNTTKKVLVLATYASVKTTKGMTLIINDTDFEKAYTNFTIRYPKKSLISRKMIVEFGNKEYSIEYLNNVNEESVELEMQCKEISH